MTKDKVIAAGGISDITYQGCTQCGTEHVGEAKETDEFCQRACTEVVQYQTGRVNHNAAMRNAPDNGE